MFKIRLKQPSSNLPVIIFWKMLEKLMYKRLYTFLNNNNVIYNLWFGFRQQYSLFHTLINITENIRKALDDGNIGCGVFVEWQKTFDTIEHQILLANLNHLGFVVFKLSI